MSVWFAALALAIGFCVAFRWKRRRLYELARKIPGTEGMPFFGELYQFSNLDLKDYGKKLLSYCNPENKITKGWFGPILVLLTDDADSIHTILNSPHALYKPWYFYNTFYMDHGLLACNGEEYDRHRKILNKSFTTSLVQKFLPTFHQKAKKCMEKLSVKVGEQDFDVFQFVGTCTLESFCSNQLNYHRDLYDSNFIKIIEETRPLVMKRLFSPWYHFKPFYRISSLSRTMDRYFKVLLTNIESIKKANIMSPQVVPKDIVINLLMDPKNKFNEEEFRDELTTFIFAGHEATAISLSSVILMLALHKDVQQRVVEEIDETVGPANDFDYHLLSNLPYMDMVLKESLRLFAPGGILGRETTSEMDLSGYKIPKGASLILSIHGMQRSPKFWGDDAHLFRPERFEPDNIKNIHPHAYEPFSGGKRVCIGLKYALAFMKIFLINFLQAYSVDSRLRYEEITLDMIPTLIVSQKYMITIRKRQSDSL